jgi:hypothetical protein
MAGRRARRTVDHMWNWIVIGALYVLGMALFYWLGGIGAAGKAIERLGQVSAQGRRRTRSPGV